MTNRTSGIPSASGGGGGSGGSGGGTNFTTDDGSKITYSLTGSVISVSDNLTNLPFTVTLPDDARHTIMQDEEMNSDSYTWYEGESFYQVNYGMSMGISFFNASVSVDFKSYVYETSSDENGVRLNYGGTSANSTTDSSEEFATVLAQIQSMFE